MHETQSNRFPLQLKQMLEEDSSSLFVNVDEEEKRRSTSRSTSERRGRSCSRFRRSRRTVDSSDDSEDCGDRNRNATLSASAKSDNWVSLSGIEFCNIPISERIETFFAFSLKSTEKRWFQHVEKIEIRKQEIENVAFERSTVSRCIQRSHETKNKS